MNQKRYSKRKEFLFFVISGGIAAIINIITRVILSKIFNFEIAVILAYFVGMLTAFLLTKKFVFIKSRKRITKSFAAFALVNLFALMQTWVVSIVLRYLLFPAIGIILYKDLIAHSIGVMIPVFSSYFGHKYISFKD